MSTEPVSTSATTASVTGIVGPSNTTFTTDPQPTSYTVSAHPPTPRNRRDERVSMRGVDPSDALRAMLQTPPAED